MIAFYEELAVVIANHGAPSWLTQAAWRAGEDCRHHAQLASELGERLAAEQQVEREVAGSGGVHAGADLSTLLDEIIVTACVGHTLAAFELEILAGRSDDTDVSWVLGRLARDVTSHAEFGWALCTWMLRRWPALRDHARGSFSAASGRAPTGLRGVLSRLGLLSPSERRELLRRAQADTVDVAAARLLGSAATARHIETWLEARRRPIVLAE